MIAERLCPLCKALLPCLSESRILLPACCSLKEELLHVLKAALPICCAAVLVADVDQ